jgi:hypothetical protein
MELNDIKKIIKESLSVDIVQDTTDRIIYSQKKL